MSRWTKGELTLVNMYQLPVDDGVHGELRVGLHCYHQRKKFCRYLVKFLKDHVNKANLVNHIKSTKEVIMYHRNSYLSIKWEVVKLVGALEPLVVCLYHGDPVLQPLKYLNLINVATVPA